MITQQLALALKEGLDQTAFDVVELPMPDVHARLDLDPPRPVLYLDSDSTPDQQYAAMEDALRVLEGGPRAARSGRPVRHLRVVP